MIPDTRDNRELITGLAAINCKYNNQPKENGRCYSSECMFNQNKNIAEEIQQKGCVRWTKLPNP